MLTAADQPLAYFMFSGRCTGGESNIGECNIHTSTCNKSAGWVRCQPGKSINFCKLKLILKR